jgi:hypothetical protein
MIRKKALENSGAFLFDTISLIMIDLLIKNEALIFMKGLSWLFHVNYFSLLY